MAYLLCFFLEWKSMYRYKLLIKSLSVWAWTMLNISDRTFCSTHIVKLVTPTVQKLKFDIKDFISKCDQIRNLITFTEKILNGKLHF